LQRLGIIKAADANAKTNDTRSAFMDRANKTLHYLRREVKRRPGFADFETTSHLYRRNWRNTSCLSATLIGRCA
jgi:hypothetical protein